jgi:hypothetical protein
MLSFKSDHQALTHFAEILQTMNKHNLGTVPDARRASVFLFLNLLQIRDDCQLQLHSSLAISLLQTPFQRISFLLG